MCAESRGVGSTTIERRNFLKPLSQKLRDLKNFILFVFFMRTGSKQKVLHQRWDTFCDQHHRNLGVENPCQ
jgi:hypothetical protein